MNITQKTHFYKIIVVGSSAVGKTSIIRQYVDLPINKDYKQTTYFERQHKIIKSEKGQNIHLTIIDTPGTLTVESLLHDNFRGVALAIIVFDITRIETFQGVDSWVKIIRENGHSDIQIMLIGNKDDLINDRAMMFQDGSIKKQQIYAKSYFEISMDDRKKINTIFGLIVDDLDDNFQNHFEFRHFDIIEEPIIQVEQQSHSKSTCCVIQ